MTKDRSASRTGREDQFRVDRDEAFLAAQLERSGLWDAIERSVREAVARRAHKRTKEARWAAARAIAPGRSTALPPPARPKGCSDFNAWPMEARAAGRGKGG